MDMYNSMDGPRGFKTKWNKWERERHMLLFIHEIKKQQTSKITKQNTEI